MDAKLYFSFIVTSYVIAVGKVRSEQTLTCKNKPYRENCIWQRQGDDGKFIDLAKNDAKYINHDSVNMTFIKMDISDSGFYRCRQFKTSNNNYFSPQIRLCVTEKGSRLTLNCNSFGQNAKNYRWDKTSPDLSFSIHQAQSFIRHRIQYTDAGTYRCRYTLQSKTDWMYSNDTIVVVQGYPEITFGYHQNKVALWVSVYLSCTIGETHPNVTDVWWTKGFGNARFHADDMKYEIQNQGTYTSLYVLNVSGNDAGEYRCCAKNTYGNMCAKTTLMTGKIPVYPKSSKDIYTVKEGTTVVLQCDPQTSIPPITELWWQKRRNGRFYNLTNSLKYSYGTVIAPNLHITDVRSSDAAEYTCNVANAFGTSQVGMEVQLGKIPIISTSSNAYFGEYGKHIMLSVSVPEIYPKVNSVDWYHNNRVIPRAYRYSLSNPNLTIRQTRLEDKGTYICRVDNGIGYANVTISLLIWRRPKVHKEGKIETTLGSDATFKCYFSESHPSIQSIIWRKGTGAAQIVLVDGGKYVIQKNVSSTTLHVKSVTISNADIYTCVAVNKFSEGTGSFSLSVGSPPLINISQDLYIIKAGDNVNISCVIRNVPENYQSTMYWNKGSHRIINYKYNPFMIITIAKLVDAGNYSCHVRNKYGPASDSAELKVLNIPLVSLPTEIKEVKKGSDTLLDCSYDSYHDPTKVFWKKDDNIIKSSNSFRRTYNGSSVEMSVLVLHDTKQSDAGNYVCVVENSIGTGYSKILELIITDHLSSDRKEYAYKTPLIITLSVTGSILVCVGLMVCYRRRQCNSNSYESPNFKQGDVHRYSTTRNTDAYDLPNIQTGDNDILGTTGSLGERNEPKETRSFTGLEFLQLFNDRDKFTRHVQLEFKNLTESYNTNQSGSEYCNTTALIKTYSNPPEHSIYLNTALTNNKRCMLLMSVVPQSNSFGQFWEFVSKNGVEQIILLTKENQQVSEFYPVSEKAIEMKSLRLALDSSEKKNKNLFVFH